MDTKKKVFSTVITGKWDGAELETSKSKFIRAFSKERIESFFVGKTIDLCKEVFNVEPDIILD
jgi:hypothetical protein